MGNGNRNSGPPGNGKRFFEPSENKREMGFLALGKRETSGPIIPWVVWEGGSMLCYATYTKFKPLSCASEVLRPYKITPHVCCALHADSGPRSARDPCSAAVPPLCAATAPPPQLGPAQYEEEPAADAAPFSGASTSPSAAEAAEDPSPTSACGSGHSDCEQHGRLHRVI
jgi:hypothetical protein